MLPLLFLTGCVNPSGMSNTCLQDPLLRASQYRDALLWYLKNTSFRVLWVENTHYDISQLGDFESYIKSGRLEYLTFDGNKYDRSLGKGYGEGLIIQYAFQHSSFLQEPSVVIKVTGRVIITNLEFQYKFIRIMVGNSSFVWFNCTRRMKWVYSRAVFSTSDFWKLYLLPLVNQIDEKEKVYFETVLKTAILHFLKHTNAVGNLFLFPLRFQGVSGTNGKLLKTSTKDYFLQPLRFVSFILNKKNEDGKV